MKSLEDNTVIAPETKPKRSPVSKFIVSLGIIVLIAFFLLAFNLYLSMKHFAAQVVCHSNLGNIGRTAFIYAEDHDGQLPAADNWHQTFISEYGCDPQILICPAAKSESCTYAINANIAGKNIEDIPPMTVFFFEIESGSNIYGGPEQLITRHGPRKKTDSNYILFVDGHTEIVKKEDFDKLNWKPKQNN